MQTNDEQQPAAATFNHPRNLHVGLARLIWCEHAHGWAVPGGRFICLEAKAREYAHLMHQLMTGAQPR